MDETVLKVIKHKISTDIKVMLISTLAFYFFGFLFLFSIMYFAKPHTYPNMSSVMCLVGIALSILIRSAIGFSQGFKEHINMSISRKNYITASIITYLSTAVFGVFVLYGINSIECVINKALYSSIALPDPSAFDIFTVNNLWIFFIIMVGMLVLGIIFGLIILRFGRKGFFVAYFTFIFSLTIVPKFFIHFTETFSGNSFAMSIAAFSPLYKFGIMIFIYILISTLCIKVIRKIEI